MTKSAVVSAVRYPAFSSVTAIFSLYEPAKLMIEPLNGGVNVSPLIAPAFAE